MSGERYYAKEHERKRVRALKERRMYERALRLDLQDEQLAQLDKARDLHKSVCACGLIAECGGLCVYCYDELGGES